MALSEEPATSASLVRAWHHLGHLLAYFLGPGTTWELQFKDIVTQVLKENQRHLKKKCTNVSSSLQKCSNRWVKLCNEFDAVSKTMEMMTDDPSSWEMEHRLNTLQTSLDKVERFIMRYEDLIEDCQMQEEEARLEEEISREEEEVTDAEMVDEEEHGDPEPSAPHEEADTEDPPPLAPTEDAVSPEGDALLMQQASQPEDPAAGSHSPRSETGTVSGEMAELSLTSPSQPGPEETQPWVSNSAGSHSPRSKTGMVSGEMAKLSLTSPSQPGPEEDETQPWVSTFTVWGTRSESSITSSGKSLKKEAGWEKTGTDPSEERDVVTTSCYSSYLIKLTNHIIIKGGGLICPPLRQQHLLIMLWFL